MPSERPLDTLPPLPPHQLCHFSVGVTLHPPSWYLLLPYMGDTRQAHLTFISAGSKNPKIALKLAEFQTDSQGKVRGLANRREASGQEEGLQGVL